MRRWGVMLALSGAAMWLSGCGNTTAVPQAKGGIAVVDLEEIARVLGQSQTVKESVTLQTNSVNQQLVKAQEEFRKQLTAKQQEFGESPTEDQKKQLAQMTAVANQRLALAKKKGEQILANNLRQAVAKLSADIREDIRPICQEIAAKRGLGIVVPRNEGFLLSVDPGVDITDEVLGVLKNRAPAAASAAPAANLEAETATADDESAPAVH